MHLQVCLHLLLIHQIHLSKAIYDIGKYYNFYVCSLYPQPEACWFNSQSQQRGFIIGLLSKALTRQLLQGLADPALSVVCYLG